MASVKEDMDEVRGKFLIMKRKLDLMEKNILEFESGGWTGGSWGATKSVMDQLIVTIEKAEYTIKSMIGDYES